MHTLSATSKKVKDLNSNLRGNRSILVDEKIMHTNVPYQPSNHENRGSVKENVRTHGNHEASKCFTVKDGYTRLKFQKRYLDRDDLAGLEENSVINKDRRIEVPQRFMARSSSRNKDLPGRDDNMADYKEGDQDVATEDRGIHTTTKTITKNSNIMVHGKRNDNDIGRAMLYITITMVLCYVPIFVRGFLEFHQVRNYVLDVISIILLLSNSSCNAIILTVFSREIRNLAKSLF